jgi:hypothetical protein
MAMAETVRNKITAIRGIIITLLHAAGLRKRFNIGNLVNDDCNFGVQKKACGDLDSSETLRFFAVFRSNKANEKR